MDPNKELPYFLCKLAGRPASVKTFEKHSVVQKKKTLAGRPAGFSQKEKEKEDPTMRQTKAPGLTFCSKTRVLKNEICKITVGNQLARYIYIYFQINLPMAPEN